MEQGPRISGVEMFIMINICLIFDAIDAVATFFDLLLGAGELMKFINNTVASAIIVPWAIIKGVRSSWLFAGTIIEYIPIINALPTRTALMIITIYLDRHPKSARIAGIVKLIKQ